MKNKKTNLSREGCTSEYARARSSTEAPGGASYSLPARALVVASLLHGASRLCSKSKKSLSIPESEICVFSLTLGHSVTAVHKNDYFIN